MSKKLWDGRFTEQTNKLVEAFTASVSYDKRLCLYDIRGSIAHCRMLAKQAIILQDEADQIVKGLEEISAEAQAGCFELDPSFEDVHMNIESRLTSKIGKVAEKLHTARSRNDQVNLDVRMYLRDEVRNVLASLTAIRHALVELAATHIDVIMPGYTHLQRAQPVLFSHHLMAYFEMFSRDRARVESSLERIDVLPLGSAALAGTTHPIDMAFTAQLLGFARISANSMDAVGSRDFIVEFLSAASMCMANLSRLSEELILWSSAEFNFASLPDAFTTGSSIMPQKKNPDVAELVRGKAGRVFGSLMAMLTIVKGLPLAYNRDLQEDKEPLFDAVDTLKSCLDVYTAMIPTIKVNRGAMAKAVAKGYLDATDFADYLVRNGMPFREAHRCAGEAVRFGIDHDKELRELSLEELKRFSSLVQADIFEFLLPEQMVNRRVSQGGTAQQNVSMAIDAARQVLASEMAAELSQQ